MQLVAYARGSETGRKPGTYVRTGLEAFRMDMGAHVHVESASIAVCSV